MHVFVVWVVSTTEKVGSYFVILWRGSDGYWLNSMHFHIMNKMNKIVDSVISRYFIMLLCKCQMLQYNKDVRLVYLTVPQNNLVTIGYQLTYLFSIQIHKIITIMRSHKHYSNTATLHLTRNACANGMNRKPNKLIH
jgi:hypothetical protein